MTQHLIIAAACMTALMAPLGASAGVSADEAARLKTELTPLGAEKAGNKDGSIPAWTGGYTTPIPGDKPGGRRGDPFKDEKPLYSITSKNAEQYADKLTEGTKALLKKYPDTFRVDVYRTHRTAAAPQWVYDNTFKNATRAKVNGDVIEGAYGGIPFPIPKAGVEVMWNHLLRWRGTSWQFQTNMYQLTTDGKAVLTTDGVGDQQIAPPAEEEHPLLALLCPRQRLAHLIDRRRADKKSRRTPDPDRGQRRERNVLLDLHYTPGIAFFSGRRRTRRTTAIVSAIPARRMKKYAWLQRSQ